MVRTRKVGMTMMLNQNRKEERAMRKGYQAPLARPAGMCCSASGDAARRSRRGAAPRRREPRAEWIRGEGRRLADASRGRAELIPQAAVRAEGRRPEARAEWNEGSHD